MRRTIAWALLVAVTASLGQAAPANALLDLVNAVRAAPPGCGGRAPERAGAPALRKTLLDLAARDQAAWIARSGRVTHDGPDGSTPEERAAARGFLGGRVTEIVYLGRTGGPERAVEWWRGDDLHCRILTDPAWGRVGSAMVRGPNGTAYVVVFAPR